MTDTGACVQHLVEMKKKNSATFYGESTIFGSGAAYPASPLNLLAIFAYAQP